PKAEVRAAWLPDRCAGDYVGQRFTSSSPSSPSGGEPQKLVEQRRVPMPARCAVAGTITAVTEQPRPTGDQDLVVDMRDVVVRRGDTTLLSSVNWQVELDERWVVLGPNGAGKTTLLRLAGAELHPSAGVVHVLGERLGGADVFELRPRIGF